MRPYKTRIWYRLCKYLTSKAFLDHREAGDLYNSYNFCSLVRPSVSYVEYCTNEGQKLQGYSIHIYRNIQCATDIIIKFVSCETYF